MKLVGSLPKQEMTGKFLCLLTYVILVISSYYIALIPKGSNFLDWCLLIFCSLT